MASKRRRIVVGVLAGLGVVVAGGVVFVNAKIAPTGTGYYVKNLCSAVFVDGLDEDRVKAEDLRPYWYVQGSVDREAQTASARLFGLAKRTAVYREGLGCTLAIGKDVETLRAEAPRFDPRPAGADAPWPVGEVVSPEPVAGVDYEALADALDYGFAEPDPERPLLTRAIVVVYADRLVGERYAEGIDASSPLLGWSMTKSLNATLVGILVGQGKLDLHAPAPVPAWQGEGDPRAAITLDQLMRMSSGLAFEEVYGPLSDATRMLFEVEDAAAVAIDMPLAHTPDTVWSYSSGTSNILGWIVRQAVEAEVEGGPGTEAAWAHYASFPRRVLFDPVGMDTAIMEPDPSGTFVASSFSHMSARDWARFGLLHLHDGVWQGQRILPEGWVEYVSTASPTAPMGQYGGQWWLNVGAPEDPSERRFPSSPRDILNASGFQGQAVIVVPSRDAVIVRLGMSHARDHLDLDGLITRVLAALPEPEPTTEPETP